MTVACLFTACGPGDTAASAGGSGSTAEDTIITGTGAATTSTGVTSAETTLTGSTYAGSDTSSETTWGSPECPDVFEGDLVLTDDTDIESLRTVHRIKGSLNVEQTSFASLEFLGCLERIDGSLRIHENPELESLEGLERLESLGDASPYDGISLYSNGALESLSALISLTAMRRLTIKDNDALTDLGLDGLETLDILAIGECMRGDEEYLYGFSNDALTTIEGFASLLNVRVEIGGQENLVSLGSLHDVEARGGELSAEFWHNPQLSADELESVGVIGCGNQGFEEELCSCPNPG